MTTEEWIARIEAVRRLDGVDLGLTASGQPILAAFVVAADRTTCAQCGRLLTKQQRYLRQQRCSIACAAIAKTGVSMHERQRRAG
jgi:hypothetical protein